MGATEQVIAKIEARLLEGASVRRVIDLTMATADEGVVVSARIDLAADLTMREVSVILHQAKRRVRSVVPEAAAVYVEPDVWVDPEAVQPTTSAVVTLSYD